MSDEPTVLESGEIRLSWDPTLRLATLSFPKPHAYAREVDARACVDALGQWITSGPIKILVDCANIRDTEPGWRAVFADWFRHHRSLVRLAWFNMSPLIAVMVQMFVRASGVDGRGFRDEAAARAWLGIPAEARSG